MKTKYTWRCGQEYAYIEMWPEDMKLVADTEGGMKKLLAEVSLFLHGHGTHIFSESPESTDKEVIFVCSRKGVK